MQDERNVGLAGSGRSVDTKVSTQGAIVVPALSVLNEQEMSEMTPQLLAAGSPELDNRLPRETPKGEAMAPKKNDWALTDGGWCCAFNCSRGN